MSASRSGADGFDGYVIRGHRHSPMSHISYSLFLLPSSCRFEFYEGIVRMAFGMMITHGAMTDASDATARFIQESILQNVPPGALLDPNMFR
jgi:hypothetical protein